MPPRTIRPVIIGLLALLPLGLIWTIPAYFDPTRVIADTSYTTPRWVSGVGGGNELCTASTSKTPMPNRLVAVNEVRAAQVGAGVIERQTTLPTIAGDTIVVLPPILVEHQFPDGQSRLAWYYGQGRFTERAQMEARAEFVYVDAASGEPLLLIKDVVISDPNFTCDQLINRWVLQYASFIISVTITGLYLLLIAIILMLFLWIRSGRKAQPQRSAT